MTPDKAPRLTAWMRPTEVAKEFGVSRQTVNSMILNGEFKSLHLLGETDKRDFYVVKRSEVEKMKETRQFPRAGAVESGATT